MSTPANKVTRADIEAKIREIQGGVVDQVESRKQKIIRVAVIAGVVVVVVTFLLGKRTGRKKTTVVEIRRV